MTGSQHPGGERLTLRAARLAEIKAGMRILDVGCGDGTSVRLLEREFGVCCKGIDISGVAGFSGDARTDPLGTDLDVALLECSLSVIGDAPLVLSRVYAALKPGGRLILSDICAKQVGTGPWTWSELLALISTAGFEILHCEDHTPALVTWAAEHMGQASVRYGYVLIIARKM